MTQKQIEILSSIEQEFNRINEQSVLETNDLISLIESRVDSKRNLRLELEAVDAINKSAIVAVKDGIIEKLKPIAFKYGFTIHINQDINRNFWYGIKVNCLGCRNLAGNEMSIEGYVRGLGHWEDGICYIKSPVPRFESKYMTEVVASEDALINHFVDGIVDALKTKV